MCEVGRALNRTGGRWDIVGGVSVTSGSRRKKRGEGLSETVEKAAPERMGVEKQSK